MGVARQLKTKPLPRCVTAEEYLAFEANSPVKTEYLHGRIYCQGIAFDPNEEGINAKLWAMGGAMPEHDRALVNLTIILGSQLRNTSCRIHSAAQRIGLPFLDWYTYPDLTVSCGKPIYDRTLNPPILENPLVVAEVLSPLTRKYDLNDKAAAYNQHDTIQDSLFISPERVYVLRYTRWKESDWSATEYNELTQTMRLDSIDCDVPLAEIYREVF